MRTFQFTGPPTKIVHSNRSSQLQKKKNEFHRQINLQNIFLFISFQTFFLHLLFFSINFTGLLRLQQIYQGLRPGNETFQVEMVKRITNVSTAIEFLRTLEDLSRWSPKYIVLDCPTDMAKEIVVSHVRDVSLGRRTYHYLLSGLVSTVQYAFIVWSMCVCVRE